MMDVIKSLIKLVLPIFVIWSIYPILKRAFRIVMGTEEKEKRKKELQVAKEKAIKNHFRQLRDGRGNLPGYRNPLPSQRIKGGRVYSDDGNSFTEDGKSYTKSDELGWDIPWFKEDEVKVKETPKKKQPTWEDEQRFRRVVAGKTIDGDNNKPDPYKVSDIVKEKPTTKKKHFSKGANPDFL
jgi:hypothetical protein